MYIVYLENHGAHSAWYSKQDAEKQAETLKNNGYRNITTGFDGAIKTDDGHYFV